MKSRIFATTFAMAMCFPAHPARAAPSALTVGNPFSNLVLPALADGRAMSIADFRGEKVILHVFASW